MGQWRPRQPSGRLGWQLFGRKEPAPRTLRRTEFWNWLTPVAACALTVLVAVGSANYRGEALEGKAVMFNAASPDAPQLVRLSQLDENVQWNVCPKVTPPTGTPLGESSALVEERRAAATNLNRN